VAVAFVQPGELEPRGSLGPLVGARVVYEVQVVLLQGLIADEGRSTED
jgi:hypothetical protein